MVDDIPMFNLLHLEAEDDTVETTAPITKLSFCPKERNESSVERKWF